MAERKIYTTTRDGRTIVDANLLLKTEKVKAFIKNVRMSFDAQRANAPLKQVPPREASK